MPRYYDYVGPKEILARALGAAPGRRIMSIKDIGTWICESGQVPDDAGLIAATYVVDEEGYLRLADRHSEHVACAGGKPVLAAGEITFVRENQKIHVSEVSNLSTGYCPEPECWVEVAAALDRAGVCHPGHWTAEFIFRRCTKCGQRNVVKDGWLVCAACGADLPESWNFDGKDVSQG